MSELKNIQSQS